MKLSALPLLLLPGLVWATDFNPSARGTTTADFLQLGVGARAEGMGEAYSAVADEASALYWNPAAMTRVEARSATFMHAAYLASSYFDYAAFTQNLGAFGAWGAGVQYFSAGSLSRTDESATDLGTFNPNDLAVSLGYAYRFQDVEFLSDLNGLSLGLSGKFIQSKILRTANTEAFDVGVLSPAYLSERLRFAFTAVNNGGKLTFNQESSPLPQAFRLGSSLKLTPAWLLGLDLAFPKDNNLYGALGTEYRYRFGQSLSLAGRLGYNTRSYSDIDGFANVAFGLGFGFETIGVDYAFMPMGGLGQAHRISLTAAF